MKRCIYLVFTMMVLPLIVPAMNEQGARLAAVSTAASTPIGAYTLHPVSYVTLSGHDGGQPVFNLTVQDQSGTQDNWNKYVEFDTIPTNTIVYTGYRSYTLPAGLSSSALTSLHVQVNYKGPVISVQTWTWRIFNWTTGTWVTLGTNAAARDWYWTHFAFTASGTLASYVSSSGEIRIDLDSNNAADNALLDYEAVVVNAPLPGPVSCPSCWHPALHTEWQWQLTTPVSTSLAITATMFDIDLFDNTASVVSTLHAQGRKVICYIDAGTWENWRSDASQFPSWVKGNTLGWPGERWLDIRQLAVLEPLMQNRMNQCQTKGFDGVEFDNVDGYTNSTGFPLTASDQLTYNTWLAGQAHQRGLSVALKNDVGQIPALQSYFDWELDEQCFEYSECTTLQPFITVGKAVMEVEYNLQPAAFCPQANTMNFNSMLKHLSLDAYRVACR